MGAIIVESQWVIRGLSPMFSKTFDLKATKSTFVTVTRQINGEKANLQLTLQRLAGDTWTDADELLPSGTTTAGGVVYTRIASGAAGSGRLKASAGDENAAATVDVFVVSGKSENPFGPGAHPIHKLGAEIARQIPVLRGSMERILITGLELAGERNSDGREASGAAEFCSIFNAHISPGPCPQGDVKVCNILHFDYVAAPAGGGTTSLNLPESTFQYLLANRISCAGVASSTLNELASRAGMTVAELRSAVDDLNDVSEVVFKVAVSSRTSPAAQGPPL
jgi:hypothetical protein